MKRRDFNQIAYDVVRQAMGEIPKVERGKNQDAVELGRTGGLKGGTARAKSLTPARRSEIAKKAASARLKKEKKNQPINIGWFNKKRHPAAV